MPEFETSQTARTYLALLLLPHNSLRLRLQPELAACREALALITDCEPEEVQNYFEAQAEKIAARFPIIFTIPSAK